MSAHPIVVGKGNIAAKIYPVMQEVILHIYTSQGQGPDL